MTITKCQGPNRIFGLKGLKVPDGLCIEAIDNMADLALFEDLPRRREDVFWDHSDFLDHDDEWLLRRFRLPRAMLLAISAEYARI